jgi:hypothetical protein
MKKILEDFKESEKEKLISHGTLQNLAKEVDPNIYLYPDVEDILIKESENFVNNVVKSSCHYVIDCNRSKVEEKDIAIILFLQYGIKLEDKSLPSNESVFINNVFHSSILSLPTSVSPFDTNKLFVQNMIKKK